MVSEKNFQIEKNKILKISKRHLAKTFSWRILGSTDTFILAWLISGNVSNGFKISMFEIFTKMILYYIHEQIWTKSKIKNSNKRHIIKTFSWRTIGTIDTVFISWIITGNPLTGLKIGLAEIISKMFLYYFHERVWYKISFGLDKRSKNRQIE